MSSNRLLKGKLARIKYGGTGLQLQYRETEAGESLRQAWVTVSSRTAWDVY